MLSEGLCVVETTENKALKGTCGIIGLTLKGNALTRYFLARHNAAWYSMTFHEEVCHNKKNKSSPTVHHSDKPATRDKLDEAVKKMCQMFDVSSDSPV